MQGLVGPRKRPRSSIDNNNKVIVEAVLLDSFIIIIKSRGNFKELLLQKYIIADIGKKETPT